MATHFHQQLERLRMTILNMAAATETALENAWRAFMERDIELAQEVIRADAKINELEIDIDQQSLRLLALDQPVAKDLRLIVASMRMSMELERIADQAVNISQRAQFLSKRSPLPPLPDLELLAGTAMDMYRVAIAAFMNQNVTQAWDVCQMDDEADELNYRILNQLIAYMVRESRAVERAVQTMCLERVADQTTNIAESVIFIAEGVNIKHRCQP
jgi:phosphate transport system protein